MKQHRYGHKFLFVLTFICALMMSMITGFINVNLGRITDYSIAGDMPLILSSAKIILKTLVVMLFISVMQVLVKKAYLKYTMIDLKVNYMDELLKRSPHFFQNMSPSKMVSNITSDTDRLEAQYYDGVLEVMWTVSRLIVSTVILVYIKPIFIVVILGMAIIFSVIANKSAQPIKKEEKKKSQSLTKYTSFIQETLNGFEVIKQHKLQDEREVEFENLADELKTKQYEVEKKTTLVDGFNSLIQVLVLVSLIAGGIFSAKHFEMQIGTLMIVVFAFSDLIWPLQNLTPLLTKLSGIVTLFDDFDQTLFEKELKSKQKVSTFKTLEFKDVTLSYDKPVVEKVNFKVKHLDKVLIVGPSGEGKSTLLKAIMQELSPTKGMITLNDMLIETVELESYYNLFANVHQKGFIFSDTTQNNITLLDNITVVNELSKISLNHLNENFVLKNDGSNVSGGERARIMLARANYFNKPIILCDEIFAALDTRVAIEIEKDMLKEDRTLINVSHIVFEENLDFYDTFLIVDEGCVTVSKDKEDVLKRMLETDVVVR